MLVPTLVMVLDPLVMVLDLVMVLLQPHPAPSCPPCPSLPSPCSSCSVMDERWDERWASSEEVEECQLLVGYEADRECECALPALDLPLPLPLGCPLGCPLGWVLPAFRAFRAFRDVTSNESKDSPRGPGEEGGGDEGGGDDRGGDDRGGDERGDDEGGSSLRCPPRWPWRQHPLLVFASHVHDDAHPLNVT